MDIASTNDLNIDLGNGKFWDKHKDFNIIWTSKLIPGGPIAYRKDLPGSLKKSLKEAFLSYKDKDGLKLLKLKGFVAASDDEYNPIRDQIEVKKKLTKK